MRDKLRTAVNWQVSLLTIGLWTAACGFYMSPALILGENQPRIFAFLVGCAIFGASQCAVLFQLVRLTRRLGQGLRVGLVLAAMTVALALHAWLDTTVYMTVFAPRVNLGPSAHVAPFGYFYLTNFFLLAPVYVLYMTCVALALSALANREKERRLAAAHAATQEAQLAALRFQVNPHFLFNALNAVTALVGAGRNAEAGQVVARLSAFFRATLNAPPGALVRLEEELDTVGSYLDIEAARFGARLVPEIDCPEELGQAMVPHFLLQPLVENAVKHGVARSKAPVAVLISAAARDGGLVIRVSDDAFPAIAAAEASGAGVGLQNVHARLAALYGEAARLTTMREGRRFVAEIHMPLSLERQDREAA